MAHDVFISYASEDKPTADAACAVLEARGLRCWITPRDIMPGQDWGEAIVDAIAGSKICLLVFSSHANASPQVKREVERAVSQGLPIIPLRIENVPPAKSLEYFISTPHWLDAFTPPLQRHLDYLADVVRRLIEGDSAPEPRPAPTPPPTPTPTPAPGWLKLGPWQGLAMAVVVLAVGYVLVEAWTGGEKPAPAAPAGPTAPATAPPVVASGTAPTSGEPQGNWAQCSELPTVAGCTAIIDGGEEMPENLAIAFVRRGIAYHKAGDTDRTIADDTQAIKLRPDFAIAYANRANAYWDKGQNAQALADLNTSLRLEPNSARVLVNRCRVLALTRTDLAQASADCGRAIQLDPDSAAALDVRGLVAFQRGDFRQAISDENAALAIDPERAPALYLRGLAKRRSGDEAAGAADMKAATDRAARVGDEFSRNGVN